jgi:hypothetical protein
MDELLALLAGTRIIRIDVKKDLRYFTSSMNRLLRAVDETEGFYSVENFAQKTPTDTVETFIKMQEEAFRIQKDMYIRIKDLELLDLSRSKIYEIMKKSGASKRLNKDSDEFRYKANRSFLFPQVELDKVIGKYNGIKFFEEAYDPDQENYQIDKNGRLLLDENRNPIKEEGFIQRNIKKIPGAIKDLILPGSPKSGFQSKIQTPPLDDMPMPMKMASNTQQKNSISNLTRTEEALLSPSEKIIAGRTT